MVRFGVIINPASRRMRRQGAIEKFKKLAKSYDVFFEAIPYAKEPSSELYLKPLQRLLDNNIDALLVCSGDGGHHLVDTALFQLLGEDNIIPQANLRGGTMNVRAESVKLPKRRIRDTMWWTTAEHTFKKFLETYGRSDPKDMKIENRRLIRIKTGDKEHLGFSYSSGLIVNFFDKYYENGGAHMNALGLVARSALSFPVNGGLLDSYLKPTKGKVFLNGEPLYEDTYKWILVTSQDINMNFGLLELAPGQLQGINKNQGLRYIGSQEITKWELVQQIPSIFNVKGMRRRKLTVSDMVIADANTVEIQPKGKHRYFVDGDIYETNKPLSLSVTSPIPYLTLPQKASRALVLYKAIPKPFSKMRRTKN